MRPEPHSPLAAPDTATDPAPTTAPYRMLASRSEGVPAVEFHFSVRIQAELLEGDPEALDAITAEFAAYLERRDEHNGLLASRRWALLVDRVTVTPGSDDIVDVRP